LGRAIAIPEKWTITVANTWATNDTCTLTINGKDLVLTVGATVTTTAIATAIKEMVNGDTITGDATRNETGDNVGEFARITATVNSSVVTLTADDDGVPFDLTVTESTAGDGTATESNTQNATGPNFWDNADNWSGDTVPVDGDTVVFDSGDVSLLYALSTGIEPAALIITPGYTGHIGLPLVNEDEPSLPYDEYRDTYLILENDAGTAACAISLEDGEGAGSGRIKLDLADCATATVNVRFTGQRAEEGVPALLIKNTASSAILNLQRGDVGVAFFDGEAGHLATVRVGFLEDQAGDSSLVCGDGVDLADAAITITGGTVSLDSATGSGTIDVYGGELEVRSAAHASIDLDGGTLFYRSTGTLTTLAVGGGAVADFRKDVRARTVTNCTLFEGGSILDPYKTVTWTNGIDVTRAALAEVTVDLGPHLTLTPSAI
jgi:hypothetical protein